MVSLEVPFVVLAGVSFEVSLPFVLVVDSVGLGCFFVVVAALSAFFLTTKLKTEKGREGRGVRGKENRRDEGCSGEVKQVREMRYHTFVSALVLSYVSV